MRIVYYAIGGGLGHLVRARAFLHTLNLSDAAVVLTASDHARDARVVGELDIAFAPKSLEANPAAFRAWLLSALARLQPDALCIDAFPAGVLGELCDLPQLGFDFWHVARLLRWNEYAAQLTGAGPHYRRVFRVEALTPPHQQFLERHSDSIEDLALVDPDGTAPVQPDAPYWLVVHSGPESEVAELVAYADEIRHAENADIALLVISASAPHDLPPAARALDVYPATSYFAAAQRIFSAAGFNVMRQMAPWRAKHCVLPMPRRFDDQFARLRREISIPAGDSLTRRG